MEPPVFAVTSYIQRLWHAIRPVSARRQLISSELPATHPSQPILHAIHHALPDQPYQELSKEEQALVDIGIYVLANQLNQAAEIAKHLLQSDAINRNLGLQLVSSLETALLVEKNRNMHEEDVKQAKA